LAEQNQKRREKIKERLQQKQKKKKREKKRVITYFMKTMARWEVEKLVILYYQVFYKRKERGLYKKCISVWKCNYSCFLKYFLLKNISK